MTPANSNTMWSKARSEAALAASFPVPIEIRSVRNARRLRLRFDEASRTLKLTCPWRTSRKAALAWALDQRDWIESQLARAEPGEPLEPGAAIPLEGQEVRLVWDPAERRTPVFAGGQIICGGPREGFARRIELFLKRRALDTMSRDVADYGAGAGLAARSVSVGDAGTRWGSCSSQGRIRLNWRLVLAPPAVRRFVVAHEVAHLAHLDHGANFKALEAELYGAGLSAAKAELRRVGPRLRRIGRRH